jgi:shikimate dehydrogenase
MNIYGVIGWPIKHSLSPAMHNAAFKELGIEKENQYKTFPVDPKDLEGFLLNKISIEDTEGNSFYIKDLAGFNITIPHKVKAKEILENNFSSAQSKEFLWFVRLSGAVNTVKREGDNIFYLNTDVSGFRESLKEDLKFEPKDKKIVVIGCGGAGRAVIAALIWEPDTHANKIYIYENSDKALESAKEHFSKFSITKEKLEFISKDKIPDVIKKCKLLVNTTPIGMKEEDTSPIDKKLLHKDLSVYDVVYNRETELIKDARLLGLRCSGGSGMLLYQGAHAFEFWTGQKAPVDVMREALLKHI